MRNGFLLFPLIAFVSTACATSKATISSYSDPSFASEEIQRLAIFPIRNARAAPSEAFQVNRRVTQEVSRKSPGLEIVTPTEAVNLLNDRELADDWADFYEGYVIGGVPDAAALDRFGQALDVNAILQGEVVSVFQEDGEFGGNKGQTRVTVRFALLGCSDGKLIWEASSDGIRKSATTLSDAPAIIEAVNLAVDKILSNMPQFGG